MKRIVTHKWPTVNRMVQMIERRICIRKLWRCRAGWGMVFVVPCDTAMPETQSARQRAEAGEGNKTVVYSYFDSLEHCVRAEYAVHVLGLNRPNRRTWWLKGGGV
jgi:hypothetical protein